MFIVKNKARGLAARALIKRLDMEFAAMRDKVTDD